MKNFTKTIYAASSFCPKFGWYIRNGIVPELTKDAKIGELVDFVESMHESFPDKDFGDFEKFIIEEGIEIHRLAREIGPPLYGFPIGQWNTLNKVYIEEKDIVKASEETKQLMKDKTIDVIFESCFLFKNKKNILVTRPDIILRISKDVWHVIEIKSTLNQSKWFELAFIKYVVMHSTNKNLIFFLMYPGYFEKKQLYFHMSSEDNNLQFPDIYDALFGPPPEDVSEEEKIEWEANPYKNKLPVEQAMEITSSLEAPYCELTTKCKRCVFYEECMRGGRNYPVEKQPFMHPSRLERLKANGWLDVRDVPQDYMFSPTQELFRRSIETNDYIIEEALSEELGNMRFPVYILDFEGIICGIPLYRRMNMWHSFFPFMYSLCVLNKNMQIVSHKTYFPNKYQYDHREFIAKKLIKQLNKYGDGSIITWGTYDKTIVRYLYEFFYHKFCKIFNTIPRGTFRGHLVNPNIREDFSGEQEEEMHNFPQLASIWNVCKELHNIYRRAIDMVPIMRNNFCHYNFDFSYSLKKVAPVLSPELSYDNLPIKDGLSASTAFVRLVRGEFNGHEKEVIRWLKDYSRLDILAPAKVLARIIELYEEKYEKTFI